MTEAERRRKNAAKQRAWQKKKRNERKAVVALELNVLTKGTPPPPNPEPADSSMSIQDRYFALKPKIEHAQIELYEFLAEKAPELLEALRLARPKQGKKMTWQEETRRAACITSIHASIQSLRESEGFDGPMVEAPSIDDY